MGQKSNKRGIKNNMYRINKQKVNFYKKLHIEQLKFYTTIQVRALSGPK